MGQIKNIKLQIVTDIKSIIQTHNESKVEEEESSTIEKKEKKDERKIQVNKLFTTDKQTNKKQTNKQTNVCTHMLIIELLLWHKRTWCSTCIMVMYDQIDGFVMANFCA